jgi:RES domain-containing protein
LTLVYRIAKTAYIRDLSGSGARLYGGRWNLRGTSLIYTSETRSLAVLEYLVHTPFTKGPGDLSLASIEVPDNPAPEEIKRSVLPRNWRDFPAPTRPANFGTTWAQLNRRLLLRVPSALVENEYNVLINPSHPDMASVSITSVKEFGFDRRLFPRR